VTGVTKMCKKCSSLKQPQPKMGNMSLYGKYVVASKINCYPKSWKPKQHSSSLLNAYLGTWKGWQVMSFFIAAKKKKEKKGWRWVV
jgi:hypothetical protein